MSKLRIINGLQLGYQRWGKGNDKTVLCLHGWLDNSNSFSYLGPRLAQHGFDVIAVDQVGHGISDHYGLFSSHQFNTYTSHVKGILDELDWKRTHIVGHSMVSRLRLEYDSIISILNC